MSSTRMEKLPTSISYDFWCKTDFEKRDTFTLVWSISDFASRTDNVIESSNFDINGPREDETWAVKVYPFGRDVEENGYVYVILFNKSYSDLHELEDFDVHVECVLSFLDVNNMKQKLVEFTTKMGGDSHHLPKIIERKNLDQIAPTGTLHLVFDIQIMDNIKKPFFGLANIFGKSSAALSQNYHQKQLREAFKKMRIL